MPQRRRFFCFGIISVCLLLTSRSVCDSQDILGKLAEKQDFKSRRVSSYDRTGGNRDSLFIEPGKTAALADIKGPAAIHHIWVTIAAEPFYGRKIILRIYWDGEETPSVEAPIGDFFGVGHGLNRNFSSLPITCSSEGRAKNCYWHMPFRWSARVTVTNEGSRPVDAFYYYIDYRELKDLNPDAPYFHAQYRQETPCQFGKNYVILDAGGRGGHYAGCNLSVLQRTMGWWGEGDDMIYVDGEEAPSLHGTGSEDYFSDAWGMREDENLFYGCPIQEEDFQAGSKATVYRFHIPDPIPFQKSIRVTIEHGHANDRADYFSSVAYWYQAEPHIPFPNLPPVEKRIPFTLESLPNFILPRWEEVKEENQAAFEDKSAGMKLSAPRLVHTLSSYYSQQGTRFPVLTSEDAGEGTAAEFSFKVEVGELYTVDLYMLRGPAMGNFSVVQMKPSESGELVPVEVGSFKGYSPLREMGVLTIKDALLQPGINTLSLQVTGKADESEGMDLAFMGMSITSSSRRYVAEWNLIAPFDAPDMDSLWHSYPPEKETDVTKSYKGKGGAEVGWRAVQAEKTGLVKLSDLVTPNEQAVAYGLSYVFSPDDRRVHMLVGSDDGVRVWLNDTLVHTKGAYRGAVPDQDVISVNLKSGWNKVLIKVLQGAGGWGYYLRFADPKNELRSSLKPEEKRDKK